MNNLLKNLKKEIKKDFNLPANRIKITTDYGN